VGWPAKNIEAAACVHEAVACFSFLLGGRDRDLFS
jgi:hypothetical protein